MLSTLFWLSRIRPLTLSFCPTLRFSMAGVRHKLEPLVGLQIGHVPFRAFVDALHRIDILMTKAGNRHWSLKRGARYHPQVDTQLTAYDIVPLGIEQAQRGQCGPQILGSSP